MLIGLNLLGNVEHCNIILNHMYARYNIMDEIANYFHDQEWNPVPQKNCYLLTEHRTPVPQYNLNSNDNFYNIHRAMESFLKTADKVI